MRERTRINAVTKMSMTKINVTQQRTKKFADHTRILTTGSALEEAANNTALAKQNKLNLNPSNTRCMIFNTKTKETELISIDNTIVERVWEKGKETSFKLVGIHTHLSQAMKLYLL